MKLFITPKQGKNFGIIILIMAFFQTKLGKICLVCALILFAWLICLINDSGPSFNTAEYQCYKYEYNERYSEPDHTILNKIGSDTLELRIYKDSIVVYALSFMDPYISMESTEWEIQSIPLVNISYIHDDVDTFILKRDKEYLPNNYNIKRIEVEGKESLSPINYKMEDSCQIALKAFFLKNDSLMQK